MKSFVQKYSVLVFVTVLVAVFTTVPFYHAHAECVGIEFENPDCIDMGDDGRSIQDPVDQESQSFYTDSSGTIDGAQDSSGSIDGAPDSSGTGLGGTDLQGLIDGLIRLINSALFILAGLAVLVFIWGIIRYLYTADDAEKRAEWRNYMIYGVIALTVITGIWGIVNAVVDLFGIGFVGPQFKSAPTTTP